MGGVLGVLTGIGLAELISRFNQIPVAVSVPAIVISVVFSTLIGVIFDFCLPLRRQISIRLRRSAGIEHFTFPMCRGTAGL